MKFNNILDLVGNTPLIQLHNILDNNNFNLFAKLEGRNPAGSVKDRVALQMILDAEKDGVLKSGSVIVEPTSGNTGIGLAFIGKAKGYRVILTMPESMSMERRQLLKAYGAELVLTPKELGMKGAIARAEELVKEIDNAVILGQFTNPSNPKAHYLTTGPEIYNDLEGKVDVFIAGVGTGGTISGVGRYLKEKNPNVKIIAIEPSTSPVISEGKSGPHGIQGIGAGFIPDTLDRNVIDEVITISTEEAYDGARLIKNKEGLLIGISAGATVAAVKRIENRDELKGKNIVILFPDGGEKYMSLPLFNE